MTMFRIFAVFVGATVALASSSIPLVAQTTPAANQSDSIAISIALDKDHLSIGQVPIALVTIKNISELEVQDVCVPENPYRVHVEGKDGEPSKTEYYRHMLGDFRPGDGPDQSGGSGIGCRRITAGSSITIKYDLTAFYDLSMPGKYSVYIEICDPSGPKDSSRLLRTKTAYFEIEAPAQ
jgi:hypothetical protein